MSKQGRADCTLCDGIAMRHWVIRGYRPSPALRWQLRNKKESRHPGWDGRRKPTYTPTRAGTAVDYIEGIIVVRGNEPDRY